MLGILLCEIEFVSTISRKGNVLVEITGEREGERERERELKCMRLMESIMYRMKIPIKDMSI
jgi:hypothetical protein